MPSAVCPSCDADLSRLGAILYTESYPGYIVTTDAGVSVLADALLIDSSASCARCGCGISFDHADLTSGGFALVDEPHTRHRSLQS